jgi:hypothetical protein
MILDNCLSHGTEGFHALCSENNVVLLFLPPHTWNQLQPLDLSLFDLTKRLLIHLNRMGSLNIQAQHAAQVVCAFLSAAVPLNVIKSFRKPGIDVFIDENCLCCRVFHGLARSILNPVSLRPVPIPEETEDEAAETDMKLALEECCELLHDLDAPDEEGQGEDNK